MVNVIFCNLNKTHICKTKAFFFFQLDLVMTKQRLHKLLLDIRPRPNA